MGVETIADSGLLKAYAKSGAQDAFAELVRRHGGMVYQTCLRILREPGAAEDAAQAAFIVLARRAKAVRGAVEPFLHGTAVNAARRARDAEKRRRKHEREAALMSDREHKEKAAAWEAIRPHIDEAVEELPARQRAVVVMQFLEGKKQEDIAKSLRLARGTVAKHSQLGLEKLRERLKKRGARLSGLALAGILSGRAAEAACPPFLVAGAAKLAAAGAGIGAAALSGNATILAKGVLNMMFWAKMKLAAAAVCVAAIVGTGTGITLTAVADGAPEKPAPQAANNKKTDPVKKKEPTAVKGLRLAIGFPKPGGVCSVKCHSGLHIANGLHKCAGCDKMCNIAHKYCHKCAVRLGACQVCGKKMKKLPEEPAFTAGDEVPMLVKLTADKDKRIYIWSRKCSWGWGRVSFRLTDTKSGRQIELKEPPKAWRKNFPTAQSVGGTSFMFDILQWAKAGKTEIPPGKYKLTAFYANKDDGGTFDRIKYKFHKNEPIWTGKLESNELVIKILQKGAAAKPAPALKPEWQGKLLVQLFDDGRNPVWSPDGKQIACCLSLKRDPHNVWKVTEGGVGVIELATGRVRKTSVSDDGSVTAVVWVKGGKELIAAGTSGALYAIAIQDDKLVPKMIKKLNIPDKVWMTMSSSPDGQYVLCKKGRRGEIDFVVLDCTGKQLASFKTTSAPLWSKDAKKLFFGCYKEFHCLHLPAGKDEKLFTSDDYFKGAAPPTSSRILLWAPKPIAPLKDGRLLVDIVESPGEPLGGRAGIVVLKGEMAVWERKDGKNIFRKLGDTLHGLHGTINYTPVGAGKTILRMDVEHHVSNVINTKMRLVNADTGKPLSELKPPQTAAYRGQKIKLMYRLVAIDRQGSSAVFNTSGRFVENRVSRPVWFGLSVLDFSSGAFKRVEIPFDTWLGGTAAFAPSGRFLALDGQMRKAGTKTRKGVWLCDPAGSGMTAGKQAPSPEKTNAR